MRALLLKTWVLTTVCMLVVACVADNPSTKEMLKKVQWPASPAKARVQYVKSFSSPEDLGIRKGFWQQLGEFFTGVEDLQLVRPMAITKTKHRLYVTDPGVKGVHLFDLENNEYKIIRLKNNENLISPVSIVNDGDGGVYLSDSALARVLHIKAGSEFATIQELDAEFEQPTGLALNNQGELFVVDTRRHQVMKFNQAGDFISVIGRRGVGEGEFNFPTMLSINKNNQLLVTDSLNFRVQVFNQHGKFVRQIGKLGSATGYQLRPKGIATDQAGNIYVVDSLFHNMQIFNSDGQFLLNVGEQGEALGQFWLPTGIHIDSQQKIYIADSYNHRVQVLKTGMLQ